jgi:uncharacterized protein (TIGR02246 family)
VIRTDTRSSLASLASALALVAALLLVGPAVPPAAAEFEPDSSGMSDAPLTVEQERAIADTLVNHLTAAWNGADVDEWIAQFWPDAESVTLRGELLSDRNEIRERQAALWTGIFKGSRVKISIRRVRGLGTAALLVLADMEITGYESLPAGIRARADGVLAAHASYALLNRFGRWRILSCQCTAVIPPPAGKPAGGR